MQLTGEFRVPADTQTVWDALNDPEVLKECIPGCEEVIKTSDTELTAKITLKMGPVKAKFAGDVTLSDMNPPNSYTLTGKGQGGAAGFASGVAKVNLADDNGGTIVTYDVDVKVGGKLAQIGSRLIDSTSKKLSKQFFDTLAEHLGGGEEEAPAEEAAPGAEAAPAAPSAAPSAAKTAATPAPAKRGGVPTPLWVAGIIGVVVILILIFAGVF